MTIQDQEWRSMIRDLVSSGGVTMSEVEGIIQRVRSSREPRLTRPEPAPSRVSPDQGLPLGHGVPETPEPELRLPWMSVYRNRIELHEPHFDGDVVTTGRYNQQFSDQAPGAALAYALNNFATPGCVIEVVGRGHNVAIGGNRNQVKTVWWEGGKVTDIDFVGRDAEPDGARSQLMITLSDSLGGWDELAFFNLDFVNMPGSAAPVLSSHFNMGGTLRFVDCDFYPEPGQTSYGGNGVKWHVRLNSILHRVFAYRCRMRPGVLEHGWYLDVVKEACFVDCEVVRPGRTGFQLVWRGDFMTKGGKYVGPFLAGGVLFKRCRVVDASGQSGGGSDFTIVGSPGGVVHLQDCESINSATGSLVVWSDWGKGLEYDRAGFTNGHLVLENFKVETDRSDRTAVMISGCREVDIHSFDVRTNRAAFDGALDGQLSRYGGPVRNGVVRWHVPGRLSQYAGFNGNSRKLGYWDEAAGVTRWLSDIDIERLEGTMAAPGGAGETPA